LPVVHSFLMAQFWQTLVQYAATWRQGKKIANEPLRVKVGER
jgi:hypothetical protein